MAHNSRDGGGKDTPEPSVARLGNSTDVESGVGAGSSAASSDDHRPVKSWKRYVWDTWDLPRAERRMLFKVDAFILTFASIGYFLKNLDQTNVNNAFLSGMKEDLNMYGNELVTSTFFLLFFSLASTSFCFCFCFRDFFFPTLVESTSKISVFS